MPPWLSSLFASLRNEIASDRWTATGAPECSIGRTVAKWSSIEEHNRPPEAQRGPAQPPKNKVTLAALQGITQPTLVVAGDADLYAPPALMKRVADRIKSAQFVTIPDTGHSDWWEVPDVFNRTVLGFVRKH